MGLGIDIGVGGRFHADRLTRALVGLGHSVLLWSSYPRSRFAEDISHCVRSVLWPELAYRSFKTIGAENLGDLLKMHLFGAGLAKKLRRSSRRDLFIGWSSFSLETLKLSQHAHRALIRDSAHMRTQLSILQREYETFGAEVPDRAKALEREEREYALADTIFVLSDFAKASFMEHGVEPSKLRVLPLGVDTRFFRPTERERFEKPLRAVYFGSVSIRKGIPHLLQAVAKLHPSDIELTVIGPVESALRPWVRSFSKVKWLGAMPQSELARRLPHYDVFVLPTVEDGFGQTLVQAMACGLVPITTDACGASRHVRHGWNGFIVKSGRSDALETALLEAALEPERLLSMRANLLTSIPALGWGDYEKTLGEWLSQIR